MTQQTTEPAEEFDLDYSIEDDIPPGIPKRDSQFVFERAPKLITDKATEGKRGRVLDVGCGFGAQMDRLRERGWETWGLEASADLANYCRIKFEDQGGAPIVVALAEAMPFRDGSLDRVVCQGSLDHFAKPREFLAEVARVLKPDGRAVIAISNFDSLSCRLGRTVYRLRERMGHHLYRGRPYWEIPPNHTFKGTLPVLRSFAGPHLELVECRGLSLFWLFNRWTWLMETLPERAAWATMRAADRIAYRMPSWSDMLVSVWRPRSNRDGRR